MTTIECNLLKTTYITYSCNPGPGEHIWKGNKYRPFHEIFIVVNGTRKGRYDIAENSLKYVNTNRTLLAVDDKTTLRIGFITNMATWRVSS